MIYIIGGNGFVGSAFVRSCEAQGIPHAVLSRGTYHQYVGGQCDVLINANGNSKRYFSRDKPVEDFDQTVRSVRSSLVDFSAKHYVHLSTCDVYPDCSSPATTRETLVPDVSRQSPYGFHKYLAEQCVRHVAPCWLIVRLGSMVGPGLKKNPIFDILNRKPLWLDPASQLQFMHTDVVAQIVFSLIERKLSRQVINLCGQGLISLQEVIEMSGNSVPVQPRSPRVRYDVCIDKISRIQPIPQTTEAVKEFVEGYAQTATARTKGSRSRREERPPRSNTCPSSS
jgi:nucleoside-diphosphate-sugar epimerase